ncbi:MAG: SDR family oxidoreductase [Geodermatophilaceae bacterium]|nr:SDR family oxidoreductase [Geodermatophilaceae bacterium]
MILVVGATGYLGGLIAHRLLELGEPVRILTRAGSSLDALAAPGAQTVTGDLKDPASLEEACSGVDAVVTTANSVLRGDEDTVESVDRVGNRNLVAAASAAGVRRFLFISALGADPGSPDEFMRAKGETEALVRGSGMAWTVLSPNLFMDVWVPAVVGGPALSGQPVTIVGSGTRQHSMVAAVDVAAYAVAAIARPEAEGQTLIIGGAQPVSWRDVVAAFEQQLDRELLVRTVEAGQPVPGLPDMMSQLLAVTDTYDSPIDMTELSARYGIPPTSLDDVVRGFLTANPRPAP